MASSFGISELRSRFDGWRSARSKDDPEPLSQPRSEPLKDTCADVIALRIVDDPVQTFDLPILLENLVIPRLIAGRAKAESRLGERAMAELIGTDRNRPLTQADAAAFAMLSIDTEASTLLDFIDNCLATGSSIDDIFVDLLAPAARHLGELWEKDRLDFVDVTMGLWRIQESLRELSMRVPPVAKKGQGTRSALFSTMPGEQHSLGTLIVAECFQRAGWDADVLMEPTQSQLTQKFVNCRYDLVGLTVSADVPMSTLSDLVTTIRSISNNPGIQIMIGGRAVNAQPDLVALCGADGTAQDAPGALAEAERLVPTKVFAQDLRD